MPAPSTDPSVLLLHGQPGSSQDWQPVRRHLSGLRVLAPDRPGYDGTPAGGFEHNAARLTGLLRRGAGSGVVVVGHSWGGGVALELALQNPDVVTGVCLVGSVGSPFALGRLDHLLALPVLRGVAGAVACWAAAVVPGAVARSTGSRLDAEQLRQVRASGRQRVRGRAGSAWAVEQRALVGDTPRLVTRLPGLSTPCLVLHGRQDTSVPLAAAVDLTARLPGSRLRVVDGGHLLPLEAPDVVAGAVRELAGQG